MRNVKIGVISVLVGAVALSACGGEGAGSGSGESGDTKIATAEFEMLNTAPEDTPEITGSAELVRRQSGTEAMIELSGLESGEDYSSHVHAGDCDQSDPGGPHFKFDLDGSDMPPNEIHLPVTADEEGNGSSEATSDSTVPLDEGRSIVLHLAEEKADGGSSMGDMSDSKKADDGHSPSNAPKLACAQLS